MEFLQSVLAWAQAHLNILAPAYMLIEYILGKTTLVKAGSVIELVLNGVKKVLEFVGVKKPAQLQ